MLVGLWSGVSRRSHLESPLDGLVSGLAAGCGMALGGLVVPAAWAQDGLLEAWLGVVTLLSAGVAVGLGVGWARLRVGMVRQLLAVLVGATVALAALVLPAASAAAVAALRWHPAGWGWAGIVALIVSLPLLVAGAFGWLLLRFEQRLVRRRLEEEAAFGVLPAWLPSLAASPVRRSNPTWWPRRDERQTLNRMLCELAIKKERVTALDADAARVYGLEVGRLRQRLRTLLDPAWAPAPRASPRSTAPRPPQGSRLQAQGSRSPAREGSGSRLKAPDPPPGKASGHQRLQNPPPTHTKEGSLQGRVGALSLEP